MKYIKGYTLIETMITVAIVALLLASVTPSFSNLSTRQSIRTGVDEIINMLTMARLQAIEQREQILICPGSGVSGCSSSWSDGLLMFRQSKPGTDFDLLIYQLEANSHTNLMGNIKQLIFNRKGTLHGQSGSLIICSKSLAKSTGKLIVINRGGRIRTIPETDARQGKQCKDGWRY